MAKYFQIVSVPTPDAFNYPGPWDPWAPPPHKHPYGTITSPIGFGPFPQAVVVEGNVTNFIPLPPLLYPALPPFGGPLVGIGIKYRDPYTPAPGMHACVGICARALLGGPNWSAIMFGASNVAWYWTTAIVTGNSGTFRLYANAYGSPITINTSLGPIVLGHGEVAGLWGNVLVGKGGAGYLGTGLGFTGAVGIAGDLLGDNQFDATLGIGSAGAYCQAGPLITNPLPTPGSIVDDPYVVIEFDITHPGGVFPGTSVVDGIDVTKTKVWVNGVLVCNGVCVLGWSVVVSGGDDKHYYLSHTIRLPTGSTTVTVYAEDLDTLNVSSTWTFTITGRRLRDESETNTYIDFPARFRVDGNLVLTTREKAVWDSIKNTIFVRLNGIPLIPLGVGIDDLVFDPRDQSLKDWLSHKIIQGLYLGVNDVIPVDNIQFDESTENTLKVVVPYKDRVTGKEQYAIMPVEQFKTDK